MAKVVAETSLKKKVFAIIFFIYISNKDAVNEISHYVFQNRLFLFRNNVFIPKHVKFYFVCIIFKLVFEFFFKLKLRLIK